MIRVLLLTNLILLLWLPVLNAQYPITPVSFEKVVLQDAFWAPRVETVRRVTVPATFRKSEETGRLKNFEATCGEATCCIHTRFPFDDSDVYKSIEGAALFLKTQRDPLLEAQIDQWIRKIKAAQEPDGYLYTWRTIRDRQQTLGDTISPVVPGAFLDWLNGPRWANEDKLSHELYNAGHLYEAATALYQATGNQALLDIALKNAELLYRDFGPGKKAVAPGHQEIELGLVKLYQTTGDHRWLQLAQKFLDVRGYGEEYSQNHQKIQDQRVAVGHAVRLGYMFAGAADVGAYTGSTAYLEAMKAVWSDIVSSQLYITGGVGATGSNEGFGGAYDLPNYSAYCETCSSIAFLWWSQRMFQLTGEGQYLDVVERTLYNALNAGLSLDGRRFFYPNALESRKNTERTEWFTCACCPPNLTRFFAGMPSLFYASRPGGLYITQFAASRTRMTILDKAGKTQQVAVEQRTDFPWESTVEVLVNPEQMATFDLYIRIPSWSQNQPLPSPLYQFGDGLELQEPIITVNGKRLAVKIEQGFVVIGRRWKPGDRVRVELDMRPRKVVADDRVKADVGRKALQRGPIVYCLEGFDQPDERVMNFFVPDSTTIRVVSDTLFGGIKSLQMNGFLVKDRDWSRASALLPLPLKAIPYFQWANRGRSNMLVWLPSDTAVVEPIAAPTLATRSSASASPGANGDLKSIADQFPVKSSNDHAPLVHWWPHFGTTEWFQYDFPAEEEVGTVKLYWFDDESTNGGCRIPASWKVMYLENGTWKPVYVPEGYTIKKDEWNIVHFEPVKTAAIKIEMRWQEGVSGGLYECQVY